jgi:hypothetical protein
MVGECVTLTRVTCDGLKQSGPTYQRGYMKTYIVCFDKLGDVTYNKVKIDENELNQLKKHTCVHMIISEETGEMIVDNVCDQEKEWVTIPTEISFTDVRNILELRWVATEDLINYQW